LDFRSNSEYSKHEINPARIESVFCGVGLKTGAAFLFARREISLVLGALEHFAFPASF